MQGPLNEEPATDTQPDLPPKLRAAFWMLVALLNLSIGALAVGLMLVGFRGQWGTGGGLVLVGTAGLVAAYFRYRTVRRKLARGELTDDGDVSDSTTDDADGTDTNGDDTVAVDDTD